ncbi:MAG: universal stress protein [Rubrobacteraceae bacterium]
MAGFPEKILVATDGANDSELAIRRAAELADTTNAELHMVYVMIMSQWMMPDDLSDNQYNRLKERAQGVLDEDTEKLNRAGQTVAQSHLKVGRRADEEVIELAEQLDADMIVVGSRGAGTLRRALMGSDAESIVRHASMPVLVVRSEKNS